MYKVQKGHRFPVPADGEDRQKNLVYSGVLDYFLKILTLTQTINGNVNFGEEFVGII